MRRPSPATIARWRSNQPMSMPGRTRACRSWLSIAGPTRSPASDALWRCNRDTRWRTSTSGSPFCRPIARLPPPASTALWRCSPSTPTRGSCAAWPSCRCSTTTKRRSTAAGPPTASGSTAFSLTLTPWTSAASRLFHSMRCPSTWPTRGGMIVTCRAASGRSRAPWSGARTRHRSGWPRPPLPASPCGSASSAGSSSITRSGRYRSGVGSLSSTAACSGCSATTRPGGSTARPTSRARSASASFRVRWAASRPGGRRSSPIARTCCYTPRSAWTRWARNLRHSALPRCNAPPGVIRAPAAIRRSTIS